jgi:hypothetical protein
VYADMFRYVSFTHIHALDLETVAGCKIDCIKRVKFEFLQSGKLDQAFHIPQSQSDLVRVTPEWVGRDKPCKMVT